MRSVTINLLTDSTDFSFIAARNVPRDLDGLGDSIGRSDLQKLTEQFLFEQLNPEDENTSESSYSYPHITSKISVF